MIPIKYFWSEKSPTNEEIYESMKLVENEDCVVIVQWTAFRYPYKMTVRKGMSFEQCKKQIPTIYGM